MSRILQGRYQALAAVLVVVVLSLVAIQTAVLAAPGGAAQDVTPDQEAVAEAIEAAVAWLLETHQNTDGGFSSFSAGADMAPSDVGGTLDALWALSTVGADVSELLAYLEANTDPLAEYVAQDGSTAGKALLALSTTDRDVSDFAGLDLPLAVTEHLSPTGQFGVNTAFNQALPIMGLAISGNSVPEEAIDWLVAQQATEGDLAGSWDDGFGTAGNADSTALALAALRVSGMGDDDPVPFAGLEFLEQAQLQSGGWEYGPGFGENANSTALVLLPLALTGQDIFSEDSRWVQYGVNPLQALLAWQGESGAFQADFGEGPFDDFFSTVQVLPALGVSQLLLGREPVGAPVVEAPPEMTPTATTAPAEPTATQEPPTTTPEPTDEPTEVPPTNTPETAAAEAESDAGDASSAESATETAAEGNDDESGGSILPWVIGIGAVVVAAGLVWWFVSGRKEG